MSAREAPSGDEVENRESVRSRGLVVLIVGNQATTEIRRKDLGRCEVLLREGRLSGSRGPYESDKRQLRDSQLHRLNTPICVGDPTTETTGPMVSNRTE